MVRCNIGVRGRGYAGARAERGSASHLYPSRIMRIPANRSNRAIEPFSLEMGYRYHTPHDLDFALLWCNILSVKPLHKIQ